MRENKKDGGKYPWIKSVFKKRKKGPVRGAEGVYAGPDYFMDGPGESKKIYAGPEFYKKKEDPSDNSRPVGDVYAGPEFFEDEPDGLVKAIYSAPVFPERPQEPPVMCVYAGPEYFSQRRDGAPVGMAQPQEKDCDGSPRCAFCGTRTPDGAKFCPECGTRLTNDE